jgi:hypothetical protein
VTKRREERLKIRKLRKKNNNKWKKKRSLLGERYFKRRKRENWIWKEIFRERMKIKVKIIK